MLKQVENDSQTGEKDWSNLLNKGALTIHNKEVKEWTTYLNIQVEVLILSKHQPTDILNNPIHHLFLTLPPPVSSAN